MPVKNNEEIREAIGYRFHNRELLQQALTHSSFARENGKGKKEHNERLEFLGDAFLDAIVGEALYLELPEAEEGVLSKTRAAIVCEQALAKAARELNLGKHIRCSRGEIKTGGRQRDSILADAMEALIGAIFLDGGYEAAKSFVLRVFDKTLKDAEQGMFIYRDYKSAVQERLQAKGILDIHYILDREEGPDHDKTFFVNLQIMGKNAGSGSGKSKKEAEQQAAKQVIERGTDAF